MKTLTITMQWNEIAQKWLMHLHDQFVYDFWDCSTVQVAFEGLDKSVIKRFEVTIKPLEN